MKYVKQVTNQQHAKALDIWGIIKKYIDINEDWAIEESTLYLDATNMEMSYVEVQYFDLSNVIKPEDFIDEVSVKTQFNLTMKEVTQMYSEISDLVELPSTLMTLRTNMKNDNVVYFDIAYVPMLK